MPENKSKVKRIPKRGFYDRKEIYSFIDTQFLCHVGFVHNGYPVVIPTMYGRENDVLYIHGAAISRLLTELEKGVAVSISVAQVTGLVLARSAFHHSLNYESVVVFGNGTLVADSDKEKALKVISDNVLKGRWEEVRKPSSKELNITKVIAIKIDEVSGKKRDEGVSDDKADYESNIWAGTIPIYEKYGKVVPDGELKDSIIISESIKNLYK